MGVEEISKAWKDEEYRENLNAEQRAQLPESPIGEVQLSEEELKGAEGAAAQPETTANCISIVTTILSNLCVSILSGGTCNADTSGCCG